MKRRWSNSGYDQVISLSRRKKGLEEVRDALTKEVLQLREDLKKAREERHKFDVTVKFFNNHHFKELIAWYRSTEVSINSDYIASELRKHLKKYPIISVEVTVDLYDKGDCRITYTITAEEQCIEQVVRHIFEEVGREVARKVIIW